MGWWPCKTNCSMGNSIWDLLWSSRDALALVKTVSIFFLKKIQIGQVIFRNCFTSTDCSWRYCDVNIASPITALPTGHNSFWSGRKNTIHTMPWLLYFYVLVGQWISLLQRPWFQVFNSPWVPYLLLNLVETWK